MQSANVSLSQKLIDSCFPDCLKHLSLLEMVLGSDSKNVRSLEKQTAHKVVQQAMQDSLKRIGLLQVFKRNSPQAYVPIIFGSSPAATRFVMENISLGDHVQFYVDEKTLAMDTGAGRQFTGELKPEDYSPIEKVFEIVQLALQRRPKTVVFEVLTGTQRKVENELTLSECFYDFAIDIKEITGYAYCLEGIENGEDRTFFCIRRMNV